MTLAFRAHVASMARDQVVTSLIACVVIVLILVIFGGGKKGKW